MNAKIVSDGKLHGGTKILLDDNTELRGVTCARWVHSVEMLPTLEVNLLQAKIEANGQLSVRMPHPVEGDFREVARIVFADGSEWAA